MKATEDGRGDSKAEEAGNEEAAEELQDDGDAENGMRSPRYGPLFRNALYARKVLVLAT